MSPSGLESSEIAGGHRTDAEAEATRNRSRSERSQWAFDRSHRRSARASGRAIQFSVAELESRPLESLHALLHSWATLWDMPLLSKSIGLRTSSRFRRSLGSFSPSRSQITLARWLLDDAPRPLLEEVLCHEAAHAAVHLVGGRRRVRPHGPEWRGFMIAAGLTPRVRIPEVLMPEGVRAAMAAGRRWEHRCPVCQATRMARTKVTRWRCRRCVEAGRSGGLVIERVGLGDSGESTTCRQPIEATSGVSVARDFSRSWIHKLGWW